jgi:hypothetical protein
MAVLLGSLDNFSKEEKRSLELFKIVINSLDKKNLKRVFIKLKEGEYEGSNELIREQMKIVALRYKNN